MADDNELLRRCQQGEEDALNELLRRYHEPIYRLAYRITGHESLAQDAAAAALVKIWTKAHQWRGDAAARTWIYRLAYSTILDVQRGQLRWWRRWFGGAWTDVADDRPNADESASRHEQIQKALATLPERDRALIHLYYFDEHSLTEIAAITGDSRDALKMRLARARQRLRPLLEDLGELE